MDYPMYDTIGEMLLSALIGLVTVVVVFSALGWYQRHLHNNSRQWVWDTRYINAAIWFILIVGGVLVHIREIPAWIRLPALGLLVIGGVMFVVIGFRPTKQSNFHRPAGPVHLRHTVADRSPIHNGGAIWHSPCGSLMNHNLRCRFCGYELVFSEGSRVSGMPTDKHQQVCPHCYGRCPICGDWYKRDKNCPEHPEAALVQCPTV